MTLNTSRARKQLATGDLRALFIEELGWDRHTATLPVTVEGTTLELHALAHKRGMLAYQCPTPQAGAYPITTAAGRLSTRLPNQRTST